MTTDTLTIASILVRAMPLEDVKDLMNELVVADASPEFTAEEAEVSEALALSMFEVLQQLCPEAIEISVSSTDNTKGERDEREETVRE